MVAVERGQAIGLGAKGGGVRERRKSVLAAHGEEQSLGETEVRSQS